MFLDFEVGLRAKSEIHISQTYTLDSLIFDLSDKTGLDFKIDAQHGEKSS